MAYDVSYKGDNSDHRALLDLVRWFGFKKSLLIFRSFRDSAAYFKANPEGSVNKWLDGAVFSIEMGGVSGHPVRRLIARFFGEQVLSDWIAS